MDGKIETRTIQVEDGVVVKDETTVQEKPVVPTRSGSCPFCLRKHLLKASGYAEELREDSSREWEREQLLKNLLLAEDHAEALGDWGFRTAIRTERIKLENGGVPETEPLLARARAKILEVGGGVKSSPVVEKAETPA